MRHSIAAVSAPQAPAAGLFVQQAARAWQHVRSVFLTAADIWREARALERRLVPRRVAS
jgi:hypothetical protein